MRGFLGPRCRWAGVLTLLAGFACTPESGSRCIPGETRSCVCPTGQMGAQSCLDDASGYGTCLCVSATTDAGVSPCETYCERSGECSGRTPGEVQDCINTCEANPPPQIDACSACFGSHSCAEIASGTCNGPCGVSCQVYCERSGECSGRTLGEIQDCINTCEANPPSQIDGCSGCFGSHSCAEIATGICNPACS